MQDFEGFELENVIVEGQQLRVRHGGSGPPLLLLHGYPETHVCWSQVAGELAQEFTVIAPDLRGYGGSGKPPADDGHQAYSKRAMAGDAVALMARMGFDRFDVAGHDRGARVGYRLALDHPNAVRRLTLMEVVPTGEVWARADDRFALTYWHWTLLNLPYPIPETIITRDPDWFLFDIQFGGAVRSYPGFAEHSQFAHDPDAIRAIYEDYRAGATSDRAVDDADRAASRRSTCPVQVLWSRSGALGAWYDPLEVWRKWADSVIGEAIEGGHSLPEDSPAATLSALRAFHGSP